MTESSAALLQRLHEEHAGALWGFCMQLTGQDAARAEDVVQETFLRAWRHVGRLDDSQGSVRSWLFTVARNIVIDEWRTRRSQSEITVAEVPDLDHGDHTDELLLSWMVADAVQRLSADHRAVLELCYYSRRSVAEAAEALGVPEGTVKSRTHYALRSLRLALLEMGVSA